MLLNRRYVHSNSNLMNFRVKIFSWGTLEIYLHEYLTHEYFHTQKFPDLRYTCIVP